MRFFLECSWRALNFNPVVQCTVEDYQIPLLRNSRHHFELKIFLLIVNETDSCLMSLLWIETLVWYLSGFLMTNVIISRVYKLGTVNICNFLNFSLQDVLYLNPNIILIILFCIISVLFKFVVEPYKIIPNCDHDWICAK